MEPGKKLQPNDCPPEANLVYASMASRWTAGNTAAFGVSTGTNSTVTVSGSQSVSGIVFNPVSVTANTAGTIFTLTAGTIGIGSGNAILASGRPGAFATSST